MKPREKLLKYGAKKLESQELIATILGSGIKGYDVFKLSKKVDSLLKEKKESISIEDLLSIKGIGRTKAISIISGFELAKRFYIKENYIIESSNDILIHVNEYRIKK